MRQETLQSLSAVHDHVFDFGVVVFAGNGDSYRTLVPSGHNGTRTLKDGKPPVTVPPWRVELLQDNPNAPVIVVERPSDADGINDMIDHMVATAPAPQLFGRTQWTMLAGRDVVIIRNNGSFKTTFRQSRLKLIASGARIVGIVEIDHDSIIADPVFAAQAIEDARRKAASEARGPDLTLMHKRLKPVPQLNMALTGRWSKWITTMAESRATAPEYVLLALLGSVSGLITGKLNIQIQPAWKEEAPLWMVAVGPSGKGKTQGLSAVGDILQHIEDGEMGRYKLAMAAWTGAGQKGAKPACQTIRVMDATPEAAGVKLARIGRGQIFWIEEMTALLNGLGRYSNPSAAERAFFIKLHDAKPASVDRRNLNDEPLLIPCLGGSIVGGVQPDVMRSFLASDEDGMKARLIYAWPDTVPTDTKPISDANWKKACTFALRAFEFIFSTVKTTKKTTVTMEDKARIRFLDWRQAYLDKLDVRYGDDIPSALAKGPGMAARIALSLAVMDAALDKKMPTTVTDDHVHRAIDLWTVLMAHRAKVEIDAHEPLNERLGRALAQHIAESRAQTISVPALRRTSGIPELRQHKLLAMALTELEEANWLEHGQRMPRNPNQPLPTTLRLRPGLMDMLKSRSN